VSTGSAKLPPLLGATPEPTNPDETRGKARRPSTDCISTLTTTMKTLTVCIEQLRRQRRETTIGVWNSEEVIRQIERNKKFDRRKAKLQIVIARAYIVVPAFYRETLHVELRHVQSLRIARHPVRIFRRISSCTRHVHGSPYISTTLILAYYFRLFLSRSVNRSDYRSDRWIVRSPSTSSTSGQGLDRRMTFVTRTECTSLTVDDRRFASNSLNRQNCFR